MKFKELAEKFDVFMKGLASPDRCDVDYADLVCFMGNAVKLYSACQVASDRPIALDEKQFSSTEAVIVISALMKAQTLNTFDVSLWLAKESTNTK